MQTSDFRWPFLIVLASIPIVGNLADPMNIGVSGVHHIPVGGRVFLPVSIEQSLWEHFSRKAEKKGVGPSELLSDLLKRDIAAEQQTQSDSEA